MGMDKIRIIFLENASKIKVFLAELQEFFKMYNLF